ncbi:M48 family metallopeptidase [Pedococcus sp. 2YAF34]|uniref:M48 family metallopeptidase n=1 Tax=Pedococcus sp. 2YAF34 TaxID=3233032 RepID=UPI003F97ADA3
MSSLALIVVTVAAVPLLAAGYLRSRGIHPLTAEQFAAGDRVVELSREFGVSRPRVLVEPVAAASAHMLSDGRQPPLLVVRLGMLHAFRSDPASFDAVVAHELGHVVNRDVLRAQLAIAAWWTLTVFVVLPYAIGSLSKWSWMNTAPLVKFVVVIAGARWLRNATLRAREFEADVVAARSPIHRAALLKLLQRAVTQGQESRWGLASTHPTPVRRLEVVGAPGRLLRASMFDVACLGALAYYSVPALEFVWQQILYGRSAMTFAPTAAALAIGAFAGAGLWRIAWRDAIAQHCIGRKRWQLPRAAAALSVGSICGANLVPTIPPGANTYGFPPLHSLTTLVVRLLVGAAAATVAASVAFGLARLAVARSRTRTTMLVLRTLGLPSVAGCCAVLLHWAILTMGLMAMAPPLVFDALIVATFTTLNEPWVWASAMLVAVLTAFLAVRRRMTDDRLPWLDPGGTP